MMYHLRYRITNLAPLVITTRQGDLNMVATKKYLLGSSVLGLLANRLIRQKIAGQNGPPHEQEQFYRWFLAGTVSIGPAFLVSRDKNGKEYHHYPAPVSIRKKKYESSAYDFLCEDENPELQTKAIKTFCVLEHDTLQKGSLQTRDVETRLHSHHARNREKGITEGEKIFTYEAIQPNQIFEGRIVGEKEDLRELFEMCGATWKGYFGRSKNAQYGKLKFEFLDDSPQDCETLQHLQNQLVQDQTISLTLLSDTIVYNQDGFSSTDINVLEEYLQGAEIIRDKAFVKQGEIENFVGVWRLRKPSETCFQAGSTFLLDVSNCDLAKLAELEERGIGERTHEGFGQCLFGRQKEPQLTVVEETDEDRFAAQQPDFPIPGTARQILKTLVKESLKKQMQVKAMKEQSEFKHIPPNSLLAKLEAFVEHKSRMDFVDSLYELRQIARNHLEQCRNPKTNLFQFLTAQFKITTPTLEALKAENLPQEILSKLASMKGKPEIKRQIFEGVLQNELGETAAEQYKALIVKHAFIPNTDLSVATVLRPSEKKLCQTIEFDPETDEHLTHDLYREYVTTFFAMMKKRAEKERTHA